MFDNIRFLFIKDLLSWTINTLSFKSKEDLYRRKRFSIFR